MKFQHYPEEDAVFIRLREGQSSLTRELGENRYVGLDSDGGIVWVSLLNVFDGVDINMLEGKDLEEASRLIEERNLRIFA